MYRSNPDQLDLYDTEFFTPFGGSLRKDNRWVVLADQIDWALVDEVYRKSFKKNTNGGQEAYSSRVAFASLYIQRKEKYTDRALVEAIAENHYMQYFLGNKEYVDEIPFDPSLLVYFRKRLNDEIMNEIIERSFTKYAAEGKDDDDENNSDAGGGKDDIEYIDKYEEVYGLDYLYPIELNRLNTI
ncbi:MAG: transposase [Eubacterium sp.]|nr:transposase [Eubacterium sp.]